MPTTCLLFLLTLIAGAKEPKLSKDQVSRIGELVVKHEGYSKIFDCDKPTYDAKEEFWRIHGGTVYPGGGVYYFEIRDSDGHYRIGHLEQRRAPRKSALRFRIPPRLKGTIAKIVAMDKATIGGKSLRTAN